MRFSRTIFTVGALVSLVLGVPSVCSAGSITYDVNLTIGAGSVTGDIVTDGTFGTLNLSDILDWNLLLSQGANTLDLTDNNSAVYYGNGAGIIDDLSATPTLLTYNFSATDTFSLLFSDFDEDPFSFYGAVCFTGAGACLEDGDTNGEVMAFAGYTDLQYASLSGSQVIATAATPSDFSTPEPGTLALLCFGIALIRFRRSHSN